jgi:dTDP-4-amino-4,6-dideoxygalactose transaminase
VTEGADPAWHLYTARFQHEQFGCTRDEFCDALRAEGVPTAVHYPRPLTQQPAFEGHVTDEPATAVDLSTRVFCLPMHHTLSDEHFDIVERALTKVCNAFRATVSA